MMNPWSLSGSLSKFGLKFGPDGVALLIQFSVVLAIGLLGGWLLRRRSPLLRSLVYRVALAGAVAAAIFSFGVNGRVPSRWTVHVTDSGRASSSGTLVAANEGQSTEDGGTTLDPGSVQPPAQFSRPAAQSPGPETEYLLPETQYLIPETLDLFFLWFVGSVGMLGWLFAGWLQIGALRRRSARLMGGSAVDLLGRLRRDGRLKTPELLISHEIQSPVLAGILHPAIILPESYETEFDPGELRAIFAHELAHLDRGDCAWNLFAAVIKSAAWFHPLAWLLCRELEEAAEDVCDQAALEVSREGREYAACLLRLSNNLSGSWPQRTIAAGVYSSSLGRRIRRILSGEREARPVSGWACAGLFAAAFAIVGLSLVLISVSSRPRPAHPVTAADRQAAQTIVRQSIAAEARLKSLTGRITIDFTGGFGASPNNKPPKETTLVELAKPYSGRISSFGWYRYEIISDGKTMSNWWDGNPHQFHYTSHPLRKEWEKYFAIGDWEWLPVQVFYGGGVKPLSSFIDRPDLHTAGTALVDGIRCQVVASTDPEENQTTNYTVQGRGGYAITKHRPNPYWHSRTLLYFGPDHLLRKSLKIGAGASFGASLGDVRTNVSLNPSDFKFRPPAGAKPLPVAPTRVSLFDRPAPDFDLPDSQGGSATVGSSVKGKKLMLLAMIDHIDLRRRELRALEQTYQALKSEGFSALVIDFNDSPAALKRGLAESPLTFPVLTPRSRAGAKALLTSYGVHVFPSSFLVDGRGYVVWSDTMYVTPGTFYIKMQLDHPEWWDRALRRSRRPGLASRKTVEDR